MHWEGYFHVFVIYMQQKYKLSEIILNKMYFKIYVENVFF